MPGRETALRSLLQTVVMAVCGGLLCAGCHSFQGFSLKEIDGDQLEPEQDSRVVSTERREFSDPEQDGIAEGPRFEGEISQSPFEESPVRQAQYQAPQRGSARSRQPTQLPTPQFIDEPAESSRSLPGTATPPSVGANLNPAVPGRSRNSLPPRVAQKAAESLPQLPADPLPDTAFPLRIPKIPKPKRNDNQYPFLFKDPLGDGPVSDGTLDPGNVQPVSLAECVQFALEHNPGIHVSQYVVPSAAEAITLQESAFDPVFKAGAQWGRSDQQVISTIEGNGIGSGGIATDTFGPPQGLTEQLSIAKSFDSGGFFEAGWETTYTFTEPAGSFLTLNPSQRSRLNFRLEQPLFRGAGEDVNRAGIQIARANHRASIHSFEASVNELIRNTQQAYWQLHLARSNVEANAQFVTEARATWQKEVTKRGLGSSSLPQIAQAREQYEAFRQELLRSRREFLSAERALRQILGMPGRSEKRLVPDTAPKKEFDFLDWETSLSEALVNRPEIAAQREAVRTAEISYESAANGLDPDVTAFANYSLSGVGNNFHDSAGTVLNNRFQDWTLGFRYERAFGRRFDQATEQQASVTLLQQRAQLRSIEHSIEHELRAAYDRLVTTSELVETLENQLAAAQVQIDANKALLDNGTISLDLFLRTKAAYAETLRQKEQVFVEYTQALADWEFAKGTIMRTADVTFSEPQLCEPEWDE